MPLIIQSPRHSFVNFNGGLTDAIIPAYNSINIQFQFMIPVEAEIALTEPLLAGVAYVSGDALPDYLMFAVRNICAWGKFEGIDFNNDFPIEVPSGPLTGVYEDAKSLYDAINIRFNISATGPVFMQCCDVDKLQTVYIPFLDKFKASKTAGINFFKAFQWVKIVSVDNPFSPGQCFRYVVASASQQFTSNLFKMMDDDEFLTKVTYSGNEKQYGFMYRPIEETSVQPATPPSAGQALVADVTSNVWNMNGAKIYAPGFPKNGLGVEVAHLTTPHFWVNGLEPNNNTTGEITGNFVDSRMNANGIWTNTNAPGTIWGPLDEWIGFSRKINTPIAKIFYIGLSGDNYVRLKVNGVEFLNTTGQNTNIPGSGIDFRTWAIYPIFLPAGDNYVEISVMNYTELNTTSNPAGFACEIYDMTSSQLIAAQSEDDLNIIFRTRDMVGQPFDIGTTIGYSCPDGWILQNVSGVYSCFKIEQTDYTNNELYLPILTKQPRYPEKRGVYIKSNKQYKIQYANIEKEWLCKTDHEPDSFHEKMAVMLAHDNIHFNNRKIDSDIVKKDEYDPDWPDDDISTTCVATFKINTPFEGRNSNCEKPISCRPTGAVSPVQPPVNNLARVDHSDITGEGSSFVDYDVYFAGAPNAVLTVTVTTYTNTNGGQLKANNNQVFLNSRVTVPLDGAGSGFMPAYAGGTVGGGGIVKGVFTITATSVGSIGANKSFEISKSF